MRESPVITKKPLDGTQRAAVFLLSLGEQLAGSVLRHMSPKDVQKIGVAMTTLKDVSKDLVTQVLNDFRDEAEGHTVLSAGAEEYIRKMLVEALGEGKANSLFDRILRGRDSKGIENLKWVDARVVAETIRHEHPQIISIVLSFLEPNHAAEVLSYLPGSIRPDLLMRISMLEGVQPSALDELDEILERQFAGKFSINSSNVGGTKIAADILNFMESSAEEKILESISEANEALSEEIQNLMFIFDDLAEIEDRGIQALLREVSTDILVLALKGADNAVKDKIFNNMSKRAAETLKDELETKGPVRLSEVEAAQKEILAIARRMAEAGEIILGNTGEDEFV